MCLIKWVILAAVQLIYKVILMHVAGSHAFPAEPYNQIMSEFVVGLPEWWKH